MKDTAIGTLELSVIGLLSKGRNMPVGSAVSLSGGDTPSEFLGLPSGRFRLAGSSCSTPAVVAKGEGTGL